MSELVDRERSLEIGVGTGQVALSLQEEGFPLVGIDIAPAMLARLVANTGGRRPFPLLVADATRLPFGKRSFDAVLCCHVLHLIPDWQAAVDEVFRVLRPSGIFLVDPGGGPDAPWSAPAEQLLERHGISRIHPGVTASDDVVGFLGTRTRVRRLAPVALTVTRNLGQDLADWQSQIFGWTWSCTPEQMKAVCDDVRAWATSERWPLDREVSLDRVIQWWVFELARDAPSGARA